MLIKKLILFIKSEAFKNIRYIMCHLFYHFKKCYIT